MKIGFDAKRLFYNATGLGNYSRSLLQNLLAFGGGDEYFLYAPDKPREIDVRDITLRPNVHTVLPEGTGKKMWRSFGVSRNIMNDGVQLYHGLSNELPFTIKESRAKSVVTIHDLIFRVYPGTYPLIDRKIYDLKFRRSCELADSIVAISQHTKEDIVRYYGIPQQKITVVYQSCNPVFYQPVSLAAKEQLGQYQLPSEYLLYVGSVEERKNLEVILKAYPLLPETYRMPLLVVGRGGRYKEKMKTLAAALGLEKYIVWLEGLHDNLQLQALYAGAAALIYPSFYEGFGLPVVEALLSRTPVITAATSSLREAGGNGSVYIDPKSAPEMAAAIQQVLDDATFAANMRQAGYQYATQQFARENLTRQMLELYSSLVR